jgi:hypothetical protein
MSDSYTPPPANVESPADDRPPANVTPPSVGVYDTPKRTPSTGMIIAGIVLLIVLIALAVLLFQLG